MSKFKALFGGGGKSQPIVFQQPDPAAQIRAQQELEAQRREADRIAGRTSQRDSLYSTLDLIDQYNQQYNPAFDKASQTAQGLLQSRGLSWDEFDDPILAAIRGALPASGYSDTSGVRSQLQSFDPKGQGVLPTVQAPDFGKLQSFDPYGVTSKVLDDIQGQRRSGYLQQFDSFAPQNFDTQFTEGLRPQAGSIIDQILGSQYEAANNQAKAASDRGNLSPIGYTNATQKIGSQKTVAKSQLDQVVDDILRGGASNLRGIANEGRSAASNYSLGQQFSVDPFRERIESEKSRFSTGLEGNIRGATGGLQLFDTPSIINAAGLEQGVSNGGVRPLFDAFASQQGDKEKKRGLGSQGVF